MEKMNRRDFFNKTGRTFLTYGVLAGFGTSFVNLNPFALSSAYAGKSKPEFDLYNSSNPSAGTLQTNTFQDCLEKRYKPGIYYRTSQAIVSIAEGIIADVRPLESQWDWLQNFGDNPDNAEGLSIEIRYGIQYRVFYFHMQNPQVEFGQRVDRHMVIGYPDNQWNHFGLMLLSADNPVDPDNYGIDHGPMRYWDKTTNIEIPRDEQDKKVEKQTTLLYEFAEYYDGPEEYTLLRKKHTSGNNVFKWSVLEKFRYLNYLFITDHRLFPSLSQGLVETMQKDFQANQPIILTLPFRQE
jgi:hypothetical protein